MSESADSAGPDAMTLALAVGQAMYDRDPASRKLGMRLEDIRPGYARMSMRVRPDMLNGHRTCHGGYLFALADSAFAFACNSHNQVTVAQGAAIEFLYPGREGDVLSAEAREVSLGRRTGIYDVVVSNQDGRQLALFRGKSYRLDGTVTGAP